MPERRVCATSRGYCAFPQRLRAQGSRRTGSGENGRSPCIRDASMHGQKWREGIMQRVQKDMVMGDKALSVKDGVPYL